MHRFKITAEKTNNGNMQRQAAPCLSAATLQIRRHKKKVKINFSTEAKKKQQSKICKGRQTTVIKSKCKMLLEFIEQHTAKGEYGKKKEHKDNITNFLLRVSLGTKQHKFSSG